MSDETTRFSKDVETRKVQRLGSSSLFITLPKKWINKWGIKPGDKIIMEVSEDGTLRLVAEKIKLNSNKRSVKIDIDSFKQSMTTAIPCLYALGYDEIVFSSRKNLEHKEVEDVMNFSKQLVGIEVSEVTEDRIKLDCLLDTEKIGIESLLRRILNIIAKKVDDIIAILKGQNQSEVQSTIEDLRRVYLMLLRRSMGGRYNSERDTLRNFIIAVNSSILLRVYHVMQKLNEVIKKDEKLRNDQEINKKLIEVFQKINDLFDEIIMSILFPSIKRISNGFTLISQIKLALSQINTDNQILLSYMDDLLTMLEEALNNSSCSLFLEEAPWIERNLSS
ncbi:MULTISPECIES: AbrB/MazE/SpoVT family DNA-binding domain-containing protein [Sulfurisphaera]|nr:MULTISPECIES: AbrB/MazE/SpoVT family DNA-binding domain-containing protein [Sulfurisphaera]MBB5252610.1 phosphate uptake regulator [Sulfurisphaera ohwakuensis]QGR16949.1 AbrB/MazE/SpoVT family DNA-binding domain-containing protein [Sulfurisphaera ohwakuensis]HII73222.1 phosphate uptake regulator PhoU [Sulfurisphaera tokodaii]